MTFPVTTHAIEMQTAKQNYVTKSFAENDLDAFFSLLCCLFSVFSLFQFQINTIYR